MAMAKKQPKRIHPGEALKALERFQTDVLMLVSAADACAEILRDDELMKSAARREVLAERLGTATRTVSKHWEMEDES